MSALRGIAFFPVPDHTKSIKWNNIYFPSACDSDLRGRTGDGITLGDLGFRQGYLSEGEHWKSCIYTHCIHVMKQLFTRRES